MARTILEIKAEILSNVAADPILSEIDNTSITSPTNLLAYIFAAAIWVHELFFDTHKTEIEKLINEAPVGTPSWYVLKSKLFQSGDVLYEVNGFLAYPVIDETKQIVSQAAYKVSGSKLFLKVAKDGALPDTLEPLDSTELAQFAGYIDRLRFAGTEIEIVSLNADRLRMYAKIYYQGIYELNDFRIRLVSAIKAYLKNLPFDGTVQYIRLVDAMQGVEGFYDIETIQLQGWSGLVSESFTRLYETKAGYIEAETDAGFTLEETLQFVSV
ncbi:hypothetical protein QNI19_14490 [Cytophagaceae bacterium DM2B3-1]|uniref:Baseplate protein J-like domain-containing protein n=1 Tax=Xanthocytophaga flava TaxID=3048013 RepID=A0ABT7CK84_9BACT|nr:hypothetical protein [Xanthocytophaga flavus]MDJ1494149.1 hypothetical protein [Xanthocytophaga flavus]